MAWSLHTACCLSLPSCFRCKGWVMCRSGCRAMKPLSCSVWVLGSARHTSLQFTGNAGSLLDTASLGCEPIPPDTSHLYCNIVLRSSPPNFITFAFSPTCWAGGLCSQDFKLGTLKFDFHSLSYVTGCSQMVEPGDKLLVKPILSASQKGCCQSDWCTQGTFARHIYPNK